MSDHLLSLAIWVPIVFGLVVLATGSDRNAPLARMLALFGALAGLLVTLPLYTGFDTSKAVMQFTEAVKPVLTIHTHSPYATAYAVAHRPIGCWTEALAMFGLPSGVPVAGYGPRGSDEAVANIRSAVVPGVPAVLLANHGVLLTRNLDHFERVPGLKISGRHLERNGRI